jgi:hypothetical protein
MLYLDKFSAVSILLYDIDLNRESEESAAFVRFLVCILLHDKYMFSLNTYKCLQKIKQKKASKVAAVAILSASFFTALVSITTVIMPVQKVRADCVGGQVNSCSDQETLGSILVQ